MSKKKVLRKVIREEIKRLEEGDVPEDIHQMALQAGFESAQYPYMYGMGEEAVSRKLAGGAKAILGSSEGHPNLMIEVGDGAYVSYGINDAETVLKNLREVNNIIKHYLDRRPEDDVYELPKGPANDIVEHLKNEARNLPVPEQTVKVP